MDSCDFELVIIGNNSSYKEIYVLAPTAAHADLETQFREIVLARIILFKSFRKLERISVTQWELTI